MPDETTDEELFTRAAELNASFRAAVADVQRQLWTEEWGVFEYGDAPSDCGDDRFRFDMGRYAPAAAQPWRFAKDPATMREELARWMEEHGYTDIEGLDYDAGVDTLTLTARNVDAGIDEISVQFHPGESHDGIEVRAKSVCRDGDHHAVINVVFPGVLEEPFRDWPARPEAEAPDDEPIFGTTEDGNPR